MGIPEGAFLNPPQEVQQGNVGKKYAFVVPNLRVVVKFLSSQIECRKIKNKWLMNSWG
jgi:hypothetical protein